VRELQRDALVELVVVERLGFASRDPHSPCGVRRTHDRSAASRDEAPDASEEIAALVRVPQMGDEREIESAVAYVELRGGQLANHEAAYLERRGELRVTARVVDVNGACTERKQPLAESFRGIAYDDDAPPTDERLSVDA
jgi:hypothetical protein